MFGPSSGNSLLAAGFVAEEPNDRTRGMTALNRSLLIGLVGTVLGCGLAYALLGAPPLLGAEDAAIGFRYARNLAEGHGIVFNPGGEHVEGFTSVSWLLLSALVFKVFGAGSLESMLLLISLGMTTATIAIVARMTFDARPRPEALAAGLVWIAAQAGYYYWAGLSLMDVAPWALALAGFAFLVDHRLRPDPSAPAWSGLPGVILLVVALVLTRPESMLVVPGAVLVAGLAYPGAPGFRRFAVEVLGTLGASVAALTAFRVWYFGVPLPNTYYTKVSPDVLWRVRAGAAYIGEYLTSHAIGWGLVVACLAMTGVGLAALVGPRSTDPASGHSADPAEVAHRADRRRFGVPVSSSARFVSAFILVGVASIVWGGGDHYQGHRFLQSWLLLGAVPLTAAVHLLAVRFDAWKTGTGRIAALSVFTVLAVLLPPQWTTYRDHGIRQQAVDVGMQGRFVGATLTDVFDEPRPELGLWMVGGASYAYLGPVKDLLGLNWTAMGMSEGDRKGPRDHAAFSVDVFWTAPPELMIPEPEVVLRGVRCVRSVLGGAMQGLLTSQRFRDSFEPVRVQRGDSEPMIAYARADWAQTAPPTVTRLGWDYCG